MLFRMTLFKKTALELEVLVFRRRESLVVFIFCDNQGLGGVQIGQAGTL